MGADDLDKESYPFEKPVHRVCISNFDMGKFQVTREQWAKVMPHNADPSSFKHNQNLPIESISWNEARTFIRLMNLFGKNDYRLPTEAEYEYATRAGTTTSRYWGNSIDDACSFENVSSLERTSDNHDAPVANCKDHYLFTAPIGSYRSNPFGLHDMLGNVFSFTEDCWHDSHVGAPDDGTARTYPSCNKRVIRGGSWEATPSTVRSSNRYFVNDDGRSGGFGFRLVRLNKHK
jgi:formylglycine-generating enzyme required for sulfatase activity